MPTRKVDCMVYGLCDMETGEIRYIGKTTLGEKRKQQHLIKALNGENTYKAKWIRSLKKRGFDFGFVILERVANIEDLSRAEQAWIAGARACGWRLTNATDGGEGTLGFSHPKSEQFKEMLSASWKKRLAAGWKFSDEALKKMSASHKGVKLTPEHKKKLSEVSKGRIKSEATCLALSKALQGHPVSDETRDKIGSKARERLATPEGKAKLMEGVRKREPFTGRAMWFKDGIVPYNLSRKEYDFAMQHWEWADLPTSDEFVDLMRYAEKIENDECEMEYLSRHSRESDAA